MQLVGGRECCDSEVRQGANMKHTFSTMSRGAVTDCLRMDGTLSFILNRGFTKNRTMGVSVSERASCHKPNVSANSREYSVIASWCFFISRPWIHVNYEWPSALKPSRPGVEGTREIYWRLRPSRSGAADLAAWDLHA